MADAKFYEIVTRDYIDPRTADLIADLQKFGYFNDEWEDIHAKISEAELAYLWEITDGHLVIIQEGIPGAGVGAMMLDSAEKHFVPKFNITIPVRGGPLFGLRYFADKREDRYHEWARQRHSQYTQGGTTRKTFQFGGSPLVFRFNGDSKYLDHYPRIVMNVEIPAGTNSNWDALQDALRERDDLQKFIADLLSEVRTFTAMRRIQMLDEICGHSAADVVFEYIQALQGYRQRLGEKFTSTTYFKDCAKPR